MNIPGLMDSNIHNTLGGYIINFSTYMVVRWLSISNVTEHKMLITIIHVLMTKMKCRETYIYNQAVSHYKIIKE